MAKADEFCRNGIKCGCLDSCSAIFFGTLPFYIAVIAYFAVINYGFCPYEESKLCEEIGEEYIVYTSKVRRWL